ASAGRASVTVTPKTAAEVEEEEFTD
ncbi:hypothetical protein JCM10207_000397, partial [Rhodosporidiobolus poonsookiae]